MSVISAGSKFSSTLQTFCLPVIGKRSDVENRSGLHNENVEKGDLTFSRKTKTFKSYTPWGCFVKPAKGPTGIEATSAGTRKTVQVVQFSNFKPLVSYGTCSIWKYWQRLRNAEANNLINPSMYFFCFVEILIFPH